MNEQEFAELAAGYALNALSPEDRAAFEAARGRAPGVGALGRRRMPRPSPCSPTASPRSPRRSRSARHCSSRIAAMPQLPETDAADAAAAPHPRPPRRPSRPCRQTAPSRSATSPPPLPDDRRPSRRSPRRNWTRGLLALAASIVLLVALGFGAVAINEYVNRPAAVVALDEIEAAPDAQSATAEVSDGGTATAHWSESVGKAVLVSDGLPAIADDQSFELWFVRDGAAISAGMFDPAGKDDATAVLDGAMQPGDVIAVTIEPQGGSPTGEPTSEPIVTIPTA